MRRVDALRWYSEVGCLAITMALIFVLRLEQWWQGGLVGLGVGVPFIVGWRLGRLDERTRGEL